MNIKDLEEQIGITIAGEVYEELNGQYPLYEKEVDDLIHDKAMEVCTGDICHYHVIDKVMENLSYDNLGVIPYGTGYVHS